MPETINAETLPLVNPANLGVILGLDGDDAGANYDAASIVYNRFRGYLTGSGSIVLSAGYEDYILAIDSASAATFTVNNDTSLEWAEMGQCTLLRKGAGTFTVLAGSGVTLLTAGRPKLRAQGSLAQLVKLAANLWLLTGDTAA